MEVELTKSVPFNDLNRIHRGIKKNVISKFSEVIDNNSFILNDEINSFENNFSKFSNTKYSVACGNGTDAIELILRSLDIGFGDEVIVPTNSFIATALAVTRTGANPVFVDNDEYYLINLNEVEKAITKKTRAIIAVNLYGQLADLKSLSGLARKYSLFLIEDAAQSHGATSSNINERPSVAAAYSFYPGKNLGAWGDGGAVTTNNKKIYEKLKLLRNMGSNKKYIHNDFGFNSRPQPLLGVVLNEKLKHLSYWNQLRNEVADAYLELLSDNEKVVLPKVMKGNYHVWHLFVIQTSNRNKIIGDINKHKVEFGIHYPIPIHRQRAYKNHKQFRENILNADNFSKQLLSLPIFPKMKDSEVERVVEVINYYT